MSETATHSPPPQTEKAFMQAVIDYARTLGYVCYHTRDSRGSQPGFPDLVIVGHGRVLFRELKRKGGRSTKAQRDWLAALRQAGGDAGLWQTEDWPAIEQELAR